MRPRQSAFLLALGLLVLAGGWYFGGFSRAPERPEIAAGSLVFPALAPSLQNAARIEITNKGKILSLVRQGDAWGVADRGGYQVQREKLREMLTGLTELSLVEPRTADPAQFARLGLDDPAKPDSTATLLRVLDGAGKPIAELITGHRRVRTQGNVPESIYIRRPGGQESWLAEGRLAVDADPAQWLDRDILNIDHTRIAAVAVTRGDVKLEFLRDGDRLILKTPAEHPPLDDFKLEEILRGLETLTFQEVKEAKDIPGEKIGAGIFVTTDGLTIEATLFRATADIWARFAITGTDAGKDEAARLAARVTGWAYQLGAWKEKALTPALEDLQAPPPQPGAPGASIPQIPGATQQ
jgi:hypothetical protein